MLFRTLNTLMIGLLGCWFVLLQAGFCEGEVLIDHEIQAYEEKVKSPDGDGKRDFYLKYLETLTTLKQILTPAPVCESSPNSSNSPTQNILIHPKAARNLHDARENASHVFGKEIPLLSIYQLAEYVEKNKKEWRKGTFDPTPFDLTLENKKKTRVHFEVDRRGKIYLVFEGKHLGKGATAVVEEVFAYKTWENVAKKSPLYKNNRENIQMLQREAELLMELAQLPMEERVGLVETYSSNYRSIFQKKYHLSYPDAPDDLLNSVDQNLSILGQLGRGMRTLHAHGIVHSDIKEDNVLLLKPDGKDRKEYQAVLTDFGTGFKPEILLKAGEDLPYHAGTPGLLPPEDRKGWSGATLEEKKKNAFKRDVFTLGISATLWLRPDLAMFAIDGGPCDRYDPVRHEFKYLDCRDQEIQKQINKEAKLEKLDPTIHFLMQALELDPRKRISSEQWVKGIDYLREKRKTPWKPEVLTLDQVLKSPSALELPQFTTHPITDLTHIPNEITARLGQTPGNYIVMPMQITDPKTKATRFSLGIAFVDKSSTHEKPLIQIKALSVDPQDKKQVEKELTFLKDIGTIHD